MGQLPDTVNERIPDASTVVSEQLAVTPEGEVQNIETGEPVTDETLVGTQDQQPDSLAKTGGESFIPVSASVVKDVVEQPVKQSVKQSSAMNGSTVRLAKFDGNQYGARWGTYNNTKAFFDYNNNLFVQQAKGVIDVSSWQGDIDWAKAKVDGVEGAIIRLGYGWGNDADAKAQRNINECKRLGNSVRHLLVLVRGRCEWRYFLDSVNRCTYMTGAICKEWARRNDEHGVLDIRSKMRRSCRMIGNISASRMVISGLMERKKVVSFCITCVILSIGMVDIRRWVVLWPMRRTWVVAGGVSVARTVMCGLVTGLPRDTS